MQQLSEKLERLQKEVKKYKSLGPEFEEIVSEYEQTLKDIKQQSEMISYLKKDTKEVQK